MDNASDSVIEDLQPIGDVQLEWGLRLQLFAQSLLVKTGLVTVDKMALWPIAKRRMPPPSWMILPAPAGVSITEREIPGRAGPLTLRLYAPAQTNPSRPVLLFLHGGGFIFGSPRSLDNLCGRIALEAGMAVASLQYRLAPDHPFPAAFDDACDAAEWLLEHHKDIASSVGVAMMGESAGGNLVAATCAYLRTFSGKKILHQTLIYPLIDCSLQSPSFSFRKPGMEPEHIEAMVRHYLQGADPRDPRASPIFATDFAGLPPALIITAECDPIRDDGHRYAKKLAAAGVPVHFLNVRDTMHGFIAMPRLSRIARDTIGFIVENMCGVRSEPTYTISSSREPL